MCTYLPCAFLLLQVAVAGCPALVLVRSALCLLLMCIHMLELIWAELETEIGLETAIVMTADCHV